MARPRLSLKPERAKRLSEKSTVPAALLLGKDADLPFPQGASLRLGSFAPFPSY